MYNKYFTHPSSTGTYNNGESNPNVAAMSSFLAWESCRRSEGKARGVVVRVFRGFRCVAHRFTCLDNSLLCLSSPNIRAHFNPHSYLKQIHQIKSVSKTVSVCQVSKKQSPNPSNPSAGTTKHSRHLHPRNTYHVFASPCPPMASQAFPNRT